MSGGFWRLDCSRTGLCFMSQNMYNSDQVGHLKTELKGLVVAGKEPNEEIA